MNVKGKSILERLDAVKPSHGTYRKARDAFNEIVNCRRERDEALAERTSLLDRIASLKRQNEALISKLGDTSARHAAERAA